MGQFGKRDATEGSTATTEPAAKASEGAPASTMRRKWGFILVADSVVTLFFLITFCVAGYMKMASPPLAVVKPTLSKYARQAPGAASGTGETKSESGEGRAAQAPKEEPKAETHAAPKQEKAAPEPPKKEEKPAAKDRPTGSPAVHAATLPKRSLEPLAAHATAKAEKSAPAPGSKPRAMAIEFTHKASSAKDVVLRGAFLVRTRGKMPMVKDSAGVWHASISLLPGSYKFSYVVDGKPTASETRVIE